MLKNVLIILLAVIAALTVIDYGRGTDHIGEQGKILQDLEARHEPQLSKFVDAWRYAHPTPSADDLVELRVQAERMKADPTVAVKNTAAIASESADRATADLGATPWWQWALLGVLTLAVAYALSFVIRLSTD
jgi:hypothetical protein